MNSTAAERLHSLDAFRAVMMLLGLVLHSAASYTYAPLREAWPFHDPPGTLAFDVLLLFIHLFRMPAFFVVAGFFGALLYSRDGARGLIRNRARRVGLPLVIFMLTALPLAGAGFLVAAQLEGTEIPADLRPRESVLRLNILGHLWFLYDLLLFYLASIVVVVVTSRLPISVRAPARAAVRSHAVSFAGALCLGAVSAITLLPMHGPGLETSASILPPPRILAAYGLFFSFGWILQADRVELIPAFGRQWKRFLAAGLILFIGYFIVLLSQPRLSPGAWHLAAIAFAGPAMWFLIFGFLGLFVRHLPAARPPIRYLADASYWMYLTHLVPITWTAALLARSSAPAAVKFVLVLAVTTISTLVTYRWWVRYTRLGVLLNGYRGERASGRP